MRLMDFPPIARVVILSLSLCGCTNSPPQQISESDTWEQPPFITLDGGDSSVVGRFLGSWLQAPESMLGRNDMYTFNPDGTRTVSDGSGINSVDQWRFSSGQLSIDDRRVEFDIDAYDIILSGQRYQRYTLAGESYSGMRVAHRGDDASAYGAAANKYCVGDYCLRYIYLGSSEEFTAHARDASTTDAISVEFWNIKEPIKMSDSGGAYRNDSIRFSPHSYDIGKKAVKFYGTHSVWGEIYFLGEIHHSDAVSADEPGGASRLLGDLMVKGFIFRDIELKEESLH